MSMKTPKKCDVVRIMFRDHVKNGDEPMTCLAYGRVWKITDEYIVVDQWAPPDIDHSREHGSNLENCCILRKTIISIDVAEWTQL